MAANFVVAIYRNANFANAKTQFRANIIFNEHINMFLYLMIVHFIFVKIYVFVEIILL